MWFLMVHSVFVVTCCFSAYVSWQFWLRVFNDFDYEMNIFIAYHNTFDSNQSNFEWICVMPETTISVSV